MSVSAHVRHLLDLVGVAEVRVAHRLVAADLRGRAAGDHAAEVDHDDAIAGRHHEAHVVLDEEHAHVALVGEPPDEARELGALVLVEPGRGFVEHHDRRPGRDGSCDADEPAPAVGELFGRLVEMRFELELVHRGDRGRRQVVVAGPEEVGDPRPPRGALVAAGADVLLDADVLEQLERLERAPQPEPGPPRRVQRSIGDRRARSILR